MPNTYTQLLTHLVFAVNNRQSLILEPVRDRIEKYICSIATHKKHKPLAIYILPYHLHFLIGPNLNKSISDLIKEIKHSSNWFINDNYLTKQKFSWQESYGAFSYSKSALNNIVQYILNQKKHHKKQTFKKEYIQFLLKFEIDYEAKYLFEFYD